MTKIRYALSYKVRTKFFEIFLKIKLDYYAKRLHKDHSCLETECFAVQVSDIVQVAQVVQVPWRDNFVEIGFEVETIISI